MATLACQWRANASLATIALLGGRSPLVQSHQRIPASSPRFQPELADGLRPHAFIGAFAAAA
jgi:hypothetical protein